MAISCPETQQQELEGTACSVTRRTQIPLESGFRRVSYGFDSLDIGFYVQWDGHWERLLGWLQDNKEQAIRKKLVRDKTPSGRTFFHLPTGKAPNYRYQLRFPEYILYIAIGNLPRDSPNVYVSILSESIWNIGVKETVQQITKDLQEFNGKIIKTLVSRFDLCVDYLLPEDLTLQFLKEHKVCRTRKGSQFDDDDVLETFYVGRRGARFQLRIYNKGKEIMTASGKRWFLKHWGLEKPDGVWRVEFQIRRPALKEFQINTVDDLFEKAPALWEYLTCKWFSLRYRDNERQNRRTVHPWWEDVQQTAHRLGEIIPIERIQKSDLLPPVYHFIKQMGGMLPSYAARLGIRDLSEATAELANDLVTYWFEKDFYNAYDQRLTRLGFSTFQ